MASPSVIEPVRRSFALLEALSRRRTSTISVLIEETGLPRPTVVRLLQEQRRTNRLLQNLLYGGLGFVLGLVAMHLFVRIRLF